MNKAVYTCNAKKWCATGIFEIGKFADAAGLKTIWFWGVKRLKQIKC